MHFSRLHAVFYISAHFKKQYYGWQEYRSDEGTMVALWRCGHLKSTYMHTWACFTQCSVDAIDVYWFALNPHKAIRLLNQFEYGFSVDRPLLICWMQQHSYHVPLHRRAYMYMYHPPQIAFPFSGLVASQEKSILNENILRKWHQSSLMHKSGNAYKGLSSLVWILLCQGCWTAVQRQPSLHKILGKLWYNRVVICDWSFL